VLMLRSSNLELTIEQNPVFNGGIFFLTEAGNAIGLVLCHSLVRFIRWSAAKR
jgi:hypothetical protein